MRLLAESLRIFLRLVSQIPDSKLLLQPQPLVWDLREVAEWSNATVSKTVIPATVSGVRILPHPSTFTKKINQRDALRRCRVISSIGRASRLQRAGQWFDPTITQFFEILKAMSNKSTHCRQCEDLSYHIAFLFCKHNDKNDNKIMMCGSVKRLVMMRIWWNW